MQSELNTNFGLDSFCCYCVVVILSSFFLQIKIMHYDGIIHSFRDLEDTYNITKWFKIAGFFQELFSEWKPHMANIVCKNYFFVSSWNKEKKTVVKGTKWQYPLINYLPKTGVEKQRQKSADDSVTKTKEAIAISFFLFWQQTHSESVPYHTG